MNLLLSLFLLLQAPHAAPPSASTGAPAAAAAAAAPMDCGLQAAILLGGLAVLYFTMIVPDNKRRREVEAIQARLVKGVKVRTNGGILGEVVATTERDVTLKIADNVKINVLRTGIAGFEGPPPAADEAAPSSKVT